MKKLLPNLILSAALLSAASLNSSAATTNAPQVRTLSPASGFSGYVYIVTDTNGAVVWPTNFWLANSNQLNRTAQALATNTQNNINNGLLSTNGNAIALTNLKVASATSPGTITSNQFSTISLQGNAQPKASLLPIMGWNSWVTLGVLPSETNDIGGSHPPPVFAIIDKLATNHMVELGWKYVTIDDGWADTNRDASGNIRAKTNAWLNGSLSNFNYYARQRGCVPGVYTERGIGSLASDGSNYLTSGGSSFNSFGHYTNDAASYANWFGPDGYIKMDGGVADKASDRYLVESFCGELAKAGNFYIHSDVLWEAWMPNALSSIRPVAKGGDVNNYPTLLLWVDEIWRHRTAYGPGFHPYLDSLGQLGTGSPDASTNHAAFIALLASDAIISGGSEFFWVVATNKMWVAVNQDPLCVVADKVSSNSLKAVWSKPLSEQNLLSRGAGTITKAVGLENRNTTSQSITVYWTNLAIPPGPALVTDVLNQSVLGYFTNSYTATVRPSNCVLIAISSGGLPARVTDTITNSTYALDFTKGRLVDVAVSFGSTITLLTTNSTDYSTDDQKREFVIRSGTWNPTFSWPTNWAVCGTAAGGSLPTTLTNYQMLRLKFDSVGSGNSNKLVEFSIANDPTFTTTWDATAAAFFHTSVGDGILTATESNAVNNLVLNYKAKGLWTLTDVIYPHVGGTNAAAQAKNLRTNFWNITWSSPVPVHDASGVTSTNVTLNWGDTTYTPSTAGAAGGVVTSNSAHMMAYCGTASPTDPATIMGVAGGNPFYSDIYRSGANWGSEGLNNASALTLSAGGNFKGPVVVSRVSASSRGIYFQGTSQFDLSTVTTGLPNASMYILGKDDGGIYQASLVNLRGESIGAGLTAQQAADMASIWDSFENALGRKAP